MYEFMVPCEVMPYTRMTQRGKYVKPNALRYLASQEEIRLHLWQQMAKNDYDMLPEREPLFVILYFYPPKNKAHTQDLDNILKAVLDACKDIVFQDDRWIDYIAVRRITDDLVISAPCFKLFVGVGSCPELERIK